MPALVAGIHVFLPHPVGKTSMAGTSPAMTSVDDNASKLALAAMAAHLSSPRNPDREWERSAPAAGRENSGEDCHERARPDEGTDADRRRADRRRSRQVD